MIKLPENFESYGDARKNGFIKMKELKESGRRVVGTYCSFVPTELVEAAGGTVVSLCASSEEPSFCKICRCIWCCIDSSEIKK